MADELAKHAPPRRFPLRTGQVRGNSRARSPINDRVIRIGSEQFFENCLNTLQLARHRVHEMRIEPQGFPIARGSAARPA